MMHLQAQECRGCQQPPEAGREAWSKFSLTALRRNPANTFILDFCPLDCDTIHFSCLKAPSLCKFCDSIFRKLKEAPTRFLFPLKDSPNPTVITSLCARPAPFLMLLLWMSYMCSVCTDASLFLHNGEKEEELLVLLA